MSAALARWRDKPAPLLPILHDIQDDVGYVPSEAVPLIAEALNLSRAEIHGVVSFYHFFRTRPPGRCVVQICMAEACQARGAEDLAASASRLLGISPHETTGDGAFTLEPVYCLGNCAISPSVRIQGELYGRVTPERLAELVTKQRGG